jgi:hypothetical protein
MFDVLGIDGAALVVSALLADMVIALMSLGLELQSSGGRLLTDVVAHVGGDYELEVEKEVEVCLEGEGYASLHMYV